MKHQTIFVLFISFVISSITLSSCAFTTAQQDETHQKIKYSEDELATFEKAYFASGCFWCVEAVFEASKGVKEAVSGYAGGSASDADYRKVSSGRTDHAEAVEVYYDPNEVSYETLLVIFFDSHNPTTLNRQGPDSGPQYRSAIFYQNEEEQKLAEAHIAQLETSGEWKDKVVTEVVPLDIFYKAEAYHQDYEANNPHNPYVQKVSIPRLNKYKQKHPELLK